MAGATLDRGPDAALIAPEETLGGIGRAVTAIPLRHPMNRRWWIAFAGALSLLVLFAAAIGWLLINGVGIWGNNNAVVWALDIASYDWWIGIASGSLLVSAALLLIGAEWRSAVNRVAETSALLCTVAAGLYPILHLGRPWFFYWNLPYPNTLALWPQFRSPLVWDAVDIVSFLVVCVSFWYIGLLPDLAALRDRAYEAALALETERGRGRRLALLKAQLYGILAAGWRGSAAHWQLWAQAYRTIGLLGLLLVVSLQTGASVMLAGSVMPGWHDTIMPVTFLVNAVLSGVGLTAALTVLIRSVYGLGALITARHLAILARLLLCLGLASLYCYAAEFFSTALHGDAYERAALVRRVTGAHAWAFWAIVACLLLPVQVFWLAAARRSPLIIAGVGILTAVGAYADHFMVLVVTLQQDFLPSSRLPYAVSLWGVATFVGSIGLFLTLFLLALRYLPLVSITETRRLALARASGAAESPADRHAAAPDEDPRDAPFWGISAEFGSEEALAAAARAVGGLQSEHVHIDAHAPVPIPGVLKPLRIRDRMIRPYAILGAALGGAGFIALCIYATAYDYAFLIGGRPRFSWPSFAVPSVSVAMMSGTLAVHLALLVLNRLPRLNHPAFNIPGFTRATQDRFFLSVEARGDRFDADQIEEILASLPADAGRPLAIRRIGR
ncbi:quinol:electron acceptor oxidoreductase subunit ActD [Methylobacterium nigriterrae]|uniref:quinol:electron acceptor oxidoreductase subunit ActD n=1 Tax=Methylobacterium nigriterrae TaxID=3127512 RepID=UPI00301392E9